MQFFMDEEAYQAELQLYESAELAKVMPRCFERYRNADSSLCSDTGYVFPAVLVDKSLP